MARQRAEDVLRHLRVARANVDILSMASEESVAVIAGDALEHIIMVEAYLRRTCEASVRARVRRNLVAIPLEGQDELSFE